MNKSGIKVMMMVSLLCFLAAACATGTPQRPEGAPKEEPIISLYLAGSGETENIRMEDYIAGVVAAEMEPSWPVNALGAQAILARTFTMENINAGRKLHGADASTNHEEFQAYDPSRINGQVMEAVEKTRGQVITHRDQYVRGWFSACCGGVTAAPGEGLADKNEKIAYLAPNIKDGCLSVTTPENKHWTAEIPLAQVRSMVQEITGQDPGPVSSAEIANKGPSGRAADLKLGSVLVPAADLRLAAGADQMRSTLLSAFKVAGDKLVVEGAGFGHGVGLCQWGAKKMAAEGKSAQDIIEFYYQDVDIQDLWE